MGKISKAKTKLHEQAVELVNSDHKLTIDERKFVLKNWNPMAEHMVGKAGAFFTPMAIAREMKIEMMDMTGKRLLDPFAGIGMLSYVMWKQHAEWENNDNFEIVCIEYSPEFVRVGKRVLPEATWIYGDAFDKSTYENLGKFDQVICNPPYGTQVKNNGWLHKNPSQYRAAEMAMKVSDHAVFLLQQDDCPFEYSGKQIFKKTQNSKYEKFHKETGIYLNMNCGIDLSHIQYKAEWVGLGPNMMFEIVIVSKNTD